MFWVFSGIKFSAFVRSAPLISTPIYRTFISTKIGSIMKLYSDQGNPMLLRILAAKNLAGIPLTVQYINYEGKIVVTSFRKSGN